MKKTKRGRTTPKPRKATVQKKTVPQQTSAGKARAFPKRNASAAAKGTAYAVLSGRPSKQAVIAVFGKTGYALSWVARADRLGITSEELCDRFKTDPNKVKKLWVDSMQENKKGAGEQ
jgi:hypothetical protein